MGRDKLPLKVGDAALLDRVHGALASCCGEIIVVGAKGYIPAEARRIPDLRPGEGPLAGIEAGLLAARHRRVFVAAGDMPFLTGDFVKHLLGLLSDHISAVVPDFGGVPHPLCAAYGREIRSAVSAALDRGVRSVRELLEELPEVRYVGEVELRRFGEPELLLTNVNSPEDLARARAILHKNA
jgi:molybdopterin-guanine dinucleotide biosynthesis protein A